MAVRRLEHVNTRSADVEATRAFYEELLGLSAGPRPPFASKGYWMYLDGQPILHLVQRPAGEAAKPDSGNVDHLAFLGGDRDAMRAKIAAAGLPFRETETQLFIHDPDGLKIEINFTQ
ncbi:MAG: glyoxalase [Acidobacteria bacterium]|nr:MAG: glyoxalase [Acidobacteriota bacterium]